MGFEPTYLTELPWKGSDSTCIVLGAICADTLIRTEMDFRPTVSRTVASDLVSPYPLMCGPGRTRTVEISGLQSQCIIHLCYGPKLVGIERLELSRTRHLVLNQTRLPITTYPHIVAQSGFEPECLYLYKLKHFKCCAWCPVRLLGHISLARWDSNPHNSLELLILNQFRLIHLRH